MKGISMKSEDEIEKKLASIKADERLSYPPARFSTNAPLALVQTSLFAMADVLEWVLSDTAASNTASTPTAGTRRQKSKSKSKASSVKSAGSPSGG
jgi:hypothetical protein